MTGRRSPARRLAAAAVWLAAWAAAAPAAAQQISAPSAIVVEPTTGDVAYALQPDQRRPIASATKLMTALLVLERAELSDVARAAPYRALAVESKIGLRPGERMTVADLLRGLLVTSANDAAVTLAEHVAGSRGAFVRGMNARARELGLRNTRFANPIGLDDARNYSTARDLATLTLQLRRFPFFRRVVDREAVTLRSGDRVRTFVNRNRLVRQVPWIDGVKTGYTQRAGYVLVGSGTQRDVTLVSVVLGTPSEAAREADTLALLQAQLPRYKRSRPVRRGRVVAQVPIRFRPGADLELAAERTFARVIRRDRRMRLKVRDLPEEVTGPIPRGTRIGTVDVRLGKRVVGSVRLVAATTVPEAGFGQRAKEYFTRPLTIVLIAAAITGSVLLALLRRRIANDRRRAHGEVSAA